MYGWGVQSEGSSDISNILRQTSQTIIPNADCKEVYEAIEIEIQDNMLCGLKNGTDSCQGDSGGPFTVEQQGKHILAGVVNFGWGCARVGQSRKNNYIL